MVLRRYDDTTLREFAGRSWKTTSGSPWRSIKHDMSDISICAGIYPAKYRPFNLGRRWSSDEGDSDENQASIVTIRRIKRYVYGSMLGSLLYFKNFQIKTAKRFFEVWTVWFSYRWKYAVGSVPQVCCYIGRGRINENQITGAIQTRSRSIDLLRLYAYWYFFFSCYIQRSPSAKRSSQTCQRRAKITTAQRRLWTP